MSDELYRYIDAKFEDQNRFIKTIVAPIYGDLVEVKLSVNGDGNGRQSLRELIRTHTHDGMIRITRKTAVSVAAISGSVATVVAAGFSIFR